MNHPAQKLLLSVFLGFIYMTTLISQDTIRVQTLTYDSTARSGNFEFPLKEEGPFRKILMKYAIRCHDAAVGSGAVGCREWDYSCNTFVTDSSIVDSSVAFHPTYKISNYSDDVFPYSNTPVLSFIERQQSDNTITRTNKEEIHSINGSSRANLTLTKGTLSGMQTFIYDAKILSSNGVRADKIYALTLESETNDAQIINLRIGIKVLNHRNPKQDAALQTGYNAVFFSNVTVADNQLQLIFDEPFEWDGTSDIAIQMSWDEIKGNDVNLITHQSDTSRLSVIEENFSFRMNGSQYVQMPKSAFDEIQNEISISYWAYGNPVNLPVNTSIIEAVDSGNKRQINIHFPWSNGRIYWDCGKVGNGGYDRIDKAAPTELIKGKWNFWVFTKNANTGEMKIYVNGELWHTGAGKNAPIGSIEKAIIGQSYLLTNPYSGRLSDFSIWNKALDGTAIKELMLHPLNVQNAGSNLQLFYSFDRSPNDQILDLSNNNRNGVLEGYRGSWHSLRGFELRQRSDALNWFDNVPNITFHQGDYQIASEKRKVRDSILNLPNRVIQYELQNKEIVGLDTQYLWEASESAVYNEAGELVDYYDIDADGELEIAQLKYFRRTPAKFELLSLVTPYGNGLDLGPEGVQFTFDVSDFAPVLQGNKRLSIELGGQFQEEMDIQFVFIKGQPYREVKSIENIWPFARGWFKPIQEDRVFEPRNILLNPEATDFKVRMSITGHGQNGEFQQRNHYLNINGGRKEFNWNVWKECSVVPIHPQGGTWLFDRAGWCPGDPTLVEELDITEYAIPGEMMEMDYGINGLNMTEANYLVSSQLVSYGPAIRTLDVDLTDIISPSKRIEYARFNPACNEPKIKVRNTGISDITSLKLQYNVRGGRVLEYDWNGNIAYLDEEIIVLPLWTNDFWASAIGSDKATFEVRILQVNKGIDEDTDNNVMTSEFELPDIHDKDKLRFEYKTNTRGSESSYTLKDRLGNVLYENSRLSNSTLYKDDLELGPGCYTLEFRDRGDDGLYYWFWERTTPRGRGSAKLTYERRPGSYRLLKSFQPDFGRFFRYDFAVKSLTSTKESEGIQFLLSTYPNPANEILNIDLILAHPTLVNYKVVDQMGRIYKETDQLTDGNTFQLEIADLNPGFYLLLVRVNDRMIQRKFLKM